LVQPPSLRVWIHAAPVTLLSESAPAMAVLPSADSAKKDLECIAAQL
jgi:hypothetical protein